MVTPTRHGSFLSRGLLLAMLGLVACSDPTSASLYSLSYPTAFGIVCQAIEGDTYQPLPLAECGTSSEPGQRQLAVITNGPTGDFAFIDLDNGGAIDTDRTVPGFTRLHVGGYLSDLAVHPSSALVYALDTVGPRLITLAPGTLEWWALDLDFVPYRVLSTTTGDALLATIPASGRLARFPLDDEGQPGAPEFFDLGGSPGALAQSDDGAHLVVAHLHHSYLSTLDPTSLTEVTRVGIVEACRDGLDNDGDGLLDRDDPGCMSADDSDETDPVLCTAELTEDCLAPEALPECANGVDDDGDGRTDLDDAGCLGRDDWTEATDDFKPMLDDPVPFTCNDGSDNDGDGLVDYPADPDCFARGSRSERGLPAPMATLSVSPDGGLAYVGYASRLQVMAVDLATGTLLDVNRVDDSLDRKLRARDHILGLEFAYVPQAITFQTLEDRLYAYISDDGGRASRVLVEEAGVPVHLADSATEEDDRTEASKPRLYVDGAEVQLGYTPIAGVPNLGPLLIETLDEESQHKRYYGIEFTDDLRSHRNETWDVTYEGRLPGTSGLTARLFNDGRAVILGGSLCDLGVLPGDLLGLTYAPDFVCGEFQPGTTYTWPIASVGADWLTLGEVGEGRSTDAETGELIIDVVGLPETNCFGRLVPFHIRAANSYVVSGSRSGFLHHVINTAQGCIEDPDGDVTFQGRAYAATLKPEAALPSCPVTSPSDELVVTPFVNPFFTFSVYPACEELADGGRNIVASSRGTQWRFSVASGFVSQTILAAKSTSYQLLSPAQDLLYVLDLAGRSLKEVSLEEFLLQASYF